MSLEIQLREREGIVLLDMKGRVVAGHEAQVFRDEIAGLLRDNNNNAILNLEHVEFIDSTGLGALVLCQGNMRKAGGTIKLVNLNKRNIELLVITKLTTMFELFDDEQDAVNSFFPDRKIKRFDILSFVKQMREE